MQVRLAGLLGVMAMTWLPAQEPGQRPPRPGAERGEQDPAGRPPRPGDFGPEDGPPPPPPPPPPPNLIFLALDLDKDGEISSKELAKAATSLAKLDKNKDGIITEDEVRPPRPPRRGPGDDFEGPPGGGPPRGGRATDPKALVDSVMKMDKNNDGKISSAELPERMTRMMTEGDTNKDGYLERSEVEALSKRQGTQGRRRTGPPGGGPPGGGPPGGGPPGRQDN